MKWNNKIVLEVISSSLLLIILCLCFLHSPQLFHQTILSFGFLFLLRGFFYFHNTKTSGIVIITILLLLSLGISLMFQTWYVQLIFLSFPPLIKEAMNRYKSYNIAFLLLPVFLFTIEYILFLKTMTVLSYLLQLTLLIACLLLYLFWFQFILKLEQYKQTIQQSLARFAIAELTDRTLNHKLALQNTMIDRYARLEEREQISRTIHNAVGHTITSAIVTLEAADVLYESDPALAKEKLITAKERMHESLEAIRRAVRMTDQQNTLLPLMDTIHTLAQSLHDFTMDTSRKVRHNLTFESTLYNAYFIDSRHSEFLNGALLEALSNGVKHGNATAFIVLAQISPQFLKLTIEDNGTSFLSLSKKEQEERISHGFGIPKMKQYLEQVGGTLLIDAKEGFSITITIPIETKKEGL